MKINIKATGFDLTPAIREYVESRVESLEKFLTKPVTSLVEVEVGIVSRHHKTGDVFRAEINLTDNGKTLFAEAQKDELYAAIDEMKDRIVHEASTKKEKKKTLEKKGDAIIKKIIHRTK